jgi:hypothetical protein
VTIKRTAPPRKVNAARRKREWLRAYGSRERAAFVRTLPCVGCGRVGFSENAHVITGGMSRKADAKDIVPLCGHLYSILVNCHGELHREGIASFEAAHGIDLAECAAQTERLWLAHSQAGAA